MEEAGDGAKASGQDARGGGTQAQGRKDPKVLLCPTYPICGPVKIKTLCNLDYLCFEKQHKGDSWCLDLNVDFKENKCLFSIHARFKFFCLFDLSNTYLRMKHPI